MGKRDIQLRIKSVKETRKITRAMKLISAAKFRKAKVMLDNVRPFYEKIQLTMKDILKHSGEVTSHYFENQHETKEERKKTLIVITGDKELCGSYNHNVIKTAEGFIDNNTGKLMIIGEVGRSYFKYKKYDVDLNFNYNVQDPTTEDADEISDLLINMYNKGLTDDIFVIFTEMKGLSQVVRTVKILPLEQRNFGDIAKEDNKVLSDMIYEPSPIEVFDLLVPHYIKGLIFSMMIESFASEQFSRMVAMDGATSNADKMIGKLVLKYNRIRQASITQEISEIIAGSSV
ncbi:F0F1 ATP synthase subunit gamma [Aceticella autotrophica]|uniref:ATP synthase gamma chain n=1 Tax=Aceticella autotrophica TaxID=2755338 RepID=A0A975AVL9_9THEO|nr:ATP synthase F1 subunit gamma [Aceticella autotrophica]QSZ27292.1 F0F1 ATP synthase subunit gamma [Aceticella autotrophica]